MTLCLLTDGSGSGIQWFSVVFSRVPRNLSMDRRVEAFSCGEKLGEELKDGTQEERRLEWMNVGPCQALPPQPPVGWQPSSPQPGTDSTCELGTLSSPISIKTTRCAVQLCLTTFVEKIGADPWSYSEYFDHWKGNVIRWNDCQISVHICQFG